jgi:hypothetical protein
MTTTRIRALEVAEGKMLLDNVHCHPPAPLDREEGGATTPEVFWALRLGEHVVISGTSFEDEDCEDRDHLHVFVVPEAKEYVFGWTQEEGYYVEYDAQHACETCKGPMVAAGRGRWICAPCAADSLQEMAEALEGEDLGEELGRMVWTPGQPDKLQQGTPVVITREFRGVNAYKDGDFAETPPWEEIEPDDIVVPVGTPASVSQYVGEGQYQLLVEHDSIDGGRLHYWVVSEDDFSSVESTAE